MAESGWIHKMIIQLIQIEIEIETWDKLYFGEAFDYQDHDEKPIQKQYHYSFDYHNNQEEDVKNILCEQEEY